MTITVKGDLSRINDEERAFFEKRLKHFEERYDLIELVVHMGIHKETSRGRPAYYCKLNVHTDRGRFHAEHQDFGGDKCLAGALEKVSRQMDK